MTGGSFDGGSGAITTNSTNVGQFLVTGGSFKSTSAILTINALNVDFRGIAAFDPNGGSVRMITTSSSTNIYSDPVVIFSTLALHVNLRVFNLMTDIEVLNELQLSTQGNNGGGLGSAGGFRVNLKGNLVRSSTGTYGGTTGGVRLIGSGLQNISMTGTDCTLPLLDFAQPASGSVKFLCDPIHQGLNDSANLGSIDLNSRKISINAGSYNMAFITYPELHVLATSSAYAAFTSLLVNHLVLAGTGTSSGSTTGEISVFGDVDVTASTVGLSGIAWIAMVGTVDQNIDTSLGTTQYLPSLKINKVSGNLTFTGVPNISGGFNYIAGAYTAPAAVQFGNGTALTSPITNNGFVWNNVEFVATNNYSFNDNMNIGGNLIFSNTSSTSLLGGGQSSRLINVSGNVSATTAGIDGDAVITLVGVNQSIDMTGAPGGASAIPALNIACSGNFAASGTIIIKAVFTYTSCTPNMVGSTLDMFPSLTAGVVNHNGLILDNFKFRTSGGENITISGGALRVNGTMTNASTFANSTAGSVDLYGNLVWGGTGNGGAGIAITLRGDDTTMSKTGVAFPQNLTIAKNAGKKVTLTASASFPTNVDVNITSGSLDMAGFNLTLTGATGFLSMDATSTVIKNGGILTVNSAPVANGAYGGGNVLP